MRNSAALLVLTCVLGATMPAIAVLPDQEPPKPRPKPTTKLPTSHSQGRNEAFEMSGEWRLEYIDSNGCRYDGTLYVNTKIADGIYRGYQKHTMTCSGNEATQDALVTIEGDDVKVQFSNARTSKGTEYSADNYYLKKNSPAILKGFNKDTKGNGRDVLLIKAK